MDLILWRHAEAQEWVEGCDDMTRVLTTRGEKQAAKMALWLDRQLPEGARIWVSPAVRAQQTAIALGRKFKTRPELSPDGSLPFVLESLQWPDSKHTTLIVGHQPMFGQLVSELLGFKSPDCSIKKGAVWWLRNREKDTLSQTVVVAVQSPETL